MPGNLAGAFLVSAHKKMLHRFHSTIFDIQAPKLVLSLFLLLQGLLNFLERMIEEEVTPFPLDLTPYDFVAANCHTADEEVGGRIE